MNKKFSTLVAAFALTAGVAGHAAETATPVAKLDAAALKGMYQLAEKNGGKILAMSEKDSLILVDPATLTGANGTVVSISSTLWCVNVTKSEDQGQSAIFDFINKKQEKLLGVSSMGLAGLENSVTTDGLKAGTDLSGWAFSAQYENKLESEMPLYTHFKEDSVVALMGSVAGSEAITMKKFGANQFKVGSTATATGYLAFTLQSAADIVLTEPEINEYLKANKNVLKFTPDYTEIKNPFTTVAFKVDSVNRYAAGGAAVADDYGFMLVKSVADSSYLRVDTAANTTGKHFNLFAWTTPKNDKNYKGYAIDSILSADGLLTNQHKFKFTYSPSSDSLYIQVQEARFYPGEGTIEKPWSASDLEVRTYGVDNNADSLWIKLQDFSTNATQVRNVTVGMKPLNTHISFNVQSCVANNDGITSIPDGVYFIKNNKGQYLTSPLYKNGTMEWVDVETESRNVAHMPAFQWIVLQDNPKYKDNSPISIYNREFSTDDATASEKHIQLFKAAGATKYAANVATILSQKVDSLTFDPVPVESVKDSLLGYKNIVASDLDVYKYKFNYFHSLNSDKFVAVAQDSILGSNNEEGARFTLLNGDHDKYGFVVTKAVKERIADLKQLYRTEYRVVLEKDTLVKAANDYYAMGEANLDGAAVDSFFFKENNHYDGKHFYAIVKADKNKIGDERVGVDDQVLSLLWKVQDLESETRISSFAIERDEEPLYRRFNNEALGEIESNEPNVFGFKEIIRGEYLMDENNREGGLMDENVNYLGMWTADKATGLAFNVDTARVNRGAGYIKPQYFISVDRRDFAGQEAGPCTLDHDHLDGITEWTCPHATKAVPGFERGKYLVSFADSLALSKNDKPYADSKNGYTRVGFVEAIRVADTLWVLPAKFAALENEKINFAELNAANKALVDAGKIGFKNVIKDDRHHNYTWSFRFLYPEDASNDKVKEESVANRFLIESMSADNSKKENWIAPKKANWLKIQNGCVVLTNKTADFNDAALGVDGALVFNVDHEQKDLATDNETIATSEVTVIAGNGQVTVANAAGKKVVITNILGQTVANTVITSDNATIAAPQGVVVVAVEGEEAVKAIVK